MQEVALFTLPHPGEGSSGRKSKKAGYSSESSGEALSRKSSFEFDLDSKQSVGDQQNFLPVTNEKIKCICSYQHDDGFLIECRECNEWQHTVCMDVKKSSIPDISYKYRCSVCMPNAIPLEIETAINLQQSFLKSYQKEQEEKDRKEKDRERKEKTENPVNKIIAEILDVSPELLERIEKEREEKERAKEEDKEEDEDEDEDEDEEEDKEEERTEKERAEEERTEIKQDNPKEKLLRLLLGWQDL